LYSPDASENQAGRLRRRSFQLARLIRYGGKRERIFSDHCALRIWVRIRQASRKIGKSRKGLRRDQAERRMRISIAVRDTLANDTLGPRRLSEVFSQPRSYSAPDLTLRVRARLRDSLLSRMDHPATQAWTSQLLAEACLLCRAV